MHNFPHRLIFLYNKIQKIYNQVLLQNYSNTNVLFKICFETYFNLFLWTFIISFWYIIEVVITKYSTKSLLLKSPKNSNSIQRFWTTKKIKRLTWKRLFSKITAQQLHFTQYFATIFCYLNLPEECNTSPLSTRSNRQKFFVS